MHVALKISSLLLLFLYTYASLFFCIYFIIALSNGQASVRFTASHPTALTSVHGSAVVPHCNAPTLHLSNERTCAHTYIHTLPILALQRIGFCRVASRRVIPSRVAYTLHSHRTTALICRTIYTFHPSRCHIP